MSYREEANRWEAEKNFEKTNEIDIFALQPSNIILIAVNKVGSESRRVHAISPYYFSYLLLSFHKKKRGFYTSLPALLPTRTLPRVLDHPGQSVLPLQ